MSNQNNDDIIIVQPANIEVLYQQDKAQIDVQIATAKTYPRNVTRAIENSMAIACLDMTTASTCTYSVPRGGRAITGVSVHLAKILAQNWGNLRIESRVIAIDDKHVTSQGICFDLENNIAIKTEVKRSIMTKTGRMNDDMITVTGNAGNSIALRNAILAVIPKGVTDKVYNSALKTITGDVSDETKLIKRRTQVFTKLKDDYGVTEAEVLGAVGRASLSNITPKDIVVIIGIGQAIKDGDTTIDLAFRSGTKKIPNVKEVNDFKARENISKWIADAKTIEEVEKCKNSIPKDDLDLFTEFEDKKRELGNK